MLKEEEGNNEKGQDPFADIFEEGTDEFVSYVRQKGGDHKTRSQKQREKIERLEKDLENQELKRQRNRERRQYQKKKIDKILNDMTPEEISIFMADRAKKRKEEREKVRNAMGEGQVMMIDLVYEPLMNSKENKSLAKQIQLITQAIKHIDNPPSIHLCSLGGQVKSQMEKMGFKYWPITLHQNVLSAGTSLNKKLVYLSPDAEEPLEHVDPNCAYILGGLIDRTIIKNASLNRAKELGIETRRLPIRQFMKSRIVLNLDHVVMMVCKFREVEDWKTAFDFAAPKRWKKDEEKGEKQKDKKELSEQDEEPEKVQINIEQKVEENLQD